MQYHVSRIWSTAHPFFFKQSQIIISSLLVLTWGRQGSGQEEVVLKEEVLMREIQYVEMFLGHNFLFSMRWLVSKLVSLY